MSTVCGSSEAAEALIRSIRREISEISSKTLGVKRGLSMLSLTDRDSSMAEMEFYYKEVQKKLAKITPLALQFANEKYPDIFIERINEILKTNYNSLDEILEKNKRFYIDNPYTSSTMTLYSSYAFKRLIEVIDETDNKKQEKIKVGRNDLCPCGSGLKYKKCCGKTVQI